MLEHEEWKVEKESFRFYPGVKERIAEISVDFTLFYLLMTLRNDVKCSIRR